MMKNLSNREIDLIFTCENCKADGNRALQPRAKSEAKGKRKTPQDTTSGGVNRSAKNVSATSGFGGGGGN
jgi:hypothetical protein